MLQTTSRKHKDFLISFLLYFYVVWKMPYIAVNTNTYLAMIALIGMLLLLFFRDVSYINHPHTVFAAAVVYFIFTLIDELVQGTVFVNSVWIAFLGLLPLVLGSLLIYHKMDKQIRILVPLIILIYAITSITTYNGLLRYPTASRLLATGSVNHAFFYQKNIGGFSYIYSLVVLHPLFVCALRCGKKKLLSIILTILLGLCVFESKYTTATLTFIISSLAHFIPLSSQPKISRFHIIAIVFFLFVALIFAPPVLYWMAEQEIFLASAEKLRDIANMLQGEEATYAGTIARQDVYSISWETFLSAPLLGSRVMSPGVSGGHSYILDTMACWGLLGLGIVVFVLLRIYAFYQQIIEHAYVYLCVILSLLLGILLSFMNSHFWPYELGFIVPIFAYRAMQLSEEASKKTPVIKIHLS